MREQLDKNGKRKKKEKRKITDHMIGQKKARNLRVVSQCFLAKLNESLRSWFKVSTARRAVNEGAQFSEKLYSNHLWNMI